MKTSDVEAEIALLARELKTPVITATFHALAEKARAKAWSRESYLAAVLARQVASRTVNGTRMRVAGAHFPQTKTREDLTFTHLPSATRDTLAHLATTTFIGRRENAVVLGPPGLGKTHLAIAIGHKACEAGYPVAFASTSSWLHRLTAAHDRTTLDIELRKLNRFRLLISDEVGYLPLDAAAGACSSNSSPAATRPARSSSPATSRSPPGARPSATTSSPPRPLTGSCTTPPSSLSTATPTAPEHTAPPTPPTPTPGGQLPDGTRGSGLTAVTLQRAHRAPDTCTLATLSHPLSPWRPGSILGLWPCAQPVVARNTAWPVDREERDVRGTVVRQRLWVEVVLAGIVVLAVVTALVPNWLERLGGEGGDAGGGGTEHAIAIGLLVAAAVLAAQARVAWRRPMVPALARDGSQAGGVR